MTVPTTKVVGLEHDGWRRAPAQDNGTQWWIHRPVAGDRAVVVNLDPGITVGDLDLFPDQKLEAIWINDQPTGDDRFRIKDDITFGALGDVVMSELLVQLERIST